jgi:tryptophanase
MVQKIGLVPVEERLKAMGEAGYNTFLLRTKDIFLDMLTDSGVNAMSDNQFAGMLRADDAYAGSMTFYEFADAVKDVLGYKYVMLNFVESHFQEECTQCPTSNTPSTE